MSYPLHHTDLYFVLKLNYSSCFNIKSFALECVAFTDLEVNLTVKDITHSS